MKRVNVEQIINGERDVIKNLNHKIMSNFLDRLIEEKAQLLERSKKLELFIDSAGFVGIGHLQQILLRVQLSAMATYAQCLNERIVLLLSEKTLTNEMGKT